MKALFYKNYRSFEGSESVSSIPPCTLDKGDVFLGTEVCVLADVPKQSFQCI